nr:hypothetical protein [Lysobacter panacisoli]
MPDVVLSAPSATSHLPFACWFWPIAMAAWPFASVRKVDDPIAMESVPPDVALPMASELIPGAEPPSSEPADARPLMPSMTAAARVAVRLDAFFRPLAISEATTHEPVEAFQTMR